MKKQIPLVAWFGIGLAALGIGAMRMLEENVWRRPEASVVLHFDFSKVETEERPKMTQLVQEQIDRRAQKLGCEYKIRELGNGRFRIEVFGHAKIGTADLGRFLSGPRLEFRLIHPDFAHLPDPPIKSAVPSGYDLLEMTTEDKNQREGSSYSAVKSTPEMDTDDISYAEAEEVSTGGYQGSLHFTEKGRKRFAEVTEANPNRFLAITLDGRIYAAPRISGRIDTDRATINGSFDVRQAMELANVLSSPLLQIPAKIVSE